MNVAHAFFPVSLLHAIAWEHIAEWVDEEVSRTGFAWQHTAVALDIVDESHVEERTEP